ncbi:MAG: sigma-54 dependent transcriptional regulator [Ignavibacteriaceae bacterium]
MKYNSLNISVYSDSNDIASIRSAVSQLELKNIEINLELPERFRTEHNEIIIIQLSGLQSPILKRLIKVKKEITNKVIFIIKKDDALLVSSVVKLGFSDIFVFPYELFKFTAHLKEIIANRSYITDNSIRAAQHLRGYTLRSILGNSPEIRKAIELAKRAASQSTSNILILGETGTGKGLIARAIHNHVRKINSPFVDIVCTAIPEPLLESELFGYEAGAFTNARNRKPGLFELAENGTLFLDEIGDLSLNIQSKLLRTIEKKVIRRLGGTNDIPVNARIITATNRELEKMVEDNLFRRDLFHRLNVVSILLPPLRDRGEDILLLANYFIEEFNLQFGKAVKKIDKDVQHFMLGYDWPGNVRELRNAIERAVLLCEGDRLTIEDFSTLVKSVDVKVQNRDEIPPHIIRADVNYAATDLKKLNRFYAREVLKRMNGNKTQAAKVLGISRPKLDVLIKPDKK